MVLAAGRHTPEEVVIPMEEVALQPQVRPRLQFLEEGGFQDLAEGDLLPNPHLQAPENDFFGLIPLRAPSTALTRQYLNLALGGASIGPLVYHMTESPELTAAAVSLVALGFIIGLCFPQNQQRFRQYIVDGGQTDALAIRTVAVLTGRQGARVTTAAVRQINRQNFSRLGHLIRFLLRPNIFFSMVTAGSIYFTRDFIQNIWEQILSFFDGDLDLGPLEIAVIALNLFGIGGLVTYNTPPLRRAVVFAFRNGITRGILQNIVRPSIDIARIGAQLAYLGARGLGRQTVRVIRNVTANAVTNTVRTTNSVAHSVGILTGCGFAIAALGIAAAASLLNLPLRGMQNASFAFPKVIGYLILSTIFFVVLNGFFQSHNSLI